MSCDDMYVCEKGVRLGSCHYKITSGKCDKFSTVQEYEEFMKKRETTK
jgi:ferredoxin